MKGTLRLNILPLLFIYCSKGLNLEIRPIDFFEKISDRTAEAYKTLPSINLTPNDGRIDKLSEGTDFPYSVTFSEKDEAFIVIVNPNITVGYLWWKKPKKLILLQSRYQAIKEKTAAENSKESAFFNELIFKL